MSELGLGMAMIQLASSGDSFEKLVASDPKLSYLAQAYAQFWASHVLPRRIPNNPAFVSEDIRDVAERSYTALVRFLIAVEAARKIDETCTHLLETPDDGSAALSLHSQLFVFFSAAGAAVELLEKAFAEKPIGANDKLFLEPDDEWGSPNWFYDRRNQLVHYRLVPIPSVGGLPAIDVAVFEGKDAPWARESRDLQDLSSMISELSNLLMIGLQKAWYRMSDRLVAPGGVTVTVLPESLTSGLP